MIVEVIETVSGHSMEIDCYDDEKERPDAQLRILFLKWVVVRCAAKMIDNFDGDWSTAIDLFKWAKKCQLRYFKGSKTHRRPDVMQTINITYVVDKVAQAVHFAFVRHLPVVNSAAVPPVVIGFEQRIVFQTSVEYELCTTDSVWKLLQVLVCFSWCMSLGLHLLRI